jgi:hypothetical protein
MRCCHACERDFFHVRVEPLLGNAGRCGAWSVCRVAYVCVTVRVWLREVVVAADVVRWILDGITWKRSDPW